MLPIAGQTAGQNGLNFFVGTVTGNPESKETVGINSVQSSHPL